METRRKTTQPKPKDGHDRTRRSFVVAVDVCENFSALAKAQGVPVSDLLQQVMTQTVTQWESDNRIDVATALRNARRAERIKKGRRRPPEAVFIELADVAVKQWQRPSSRRDPFAIARYKALADLRAEQLPPEAIMTIIEKLWDTVRRRLESWELADAAVNEWLRQNITLSEFEQFVLSDNSSADDVFESVSRVFPTYTQQQAATLCSTLHRQERTSTIS